MTYQLIVLYGQPEDPAAFDAHYEQVHAPLAAALPGLESYTTVRADPGPEGAVSTYLLARLTFPDVAAYATAMTSDAGRRVARDVTNFATGGAKIVAGEVTTIL